MAKLGRNDPCPCGSGKKYKHCCLARETARLQLLQEERDAKMRAADWLTDNYGEAVEEAARDRFFLDEEGDMPERIAELSEDTRTVVLVCLHEWLIADAHFIIGGEWVKAGDLVLGPGGPLFTAAGRRHVEALAASELSLYEVLEVHEGKGLLLRDLVHTGEAPVFVHEVMATKSLVPWDILGARILRQDGKNSLGGGVYPFKRERGKELGAFILKAVQREARKKRPKATAREIITFCIISGWLDDITAPPSIPMLVDAKTNEPILFTMDQYRVSDWRALEDILEAREDVEREDENVWTWAESISEERYRSLARLERLPSGMLEVECRTKGLAETARKWLTKLAGPLLSHAGRKTEDPREKLLANPRSGPGPEPRGQESEIPLEVQREIIADFLAEHYAKWPTIPLPALNGKTPDQAARLKTYRPKLVELLKQLEQGEAKRTKESGLPPFDFGFLWVRFGLTRQ